MPERPENMPWEKCDQCNPAMINGVYCHETGCPNEWRDIKKDCFECGFDFYREYQFDEVCKECQQSALNNIFRFTEGE